MLLSRSFIWLIENELLPPILRVTDGKHIKPIIIRSITYFGQRIYNRRTSNLLLQSFEYSFGYNKTVIEGELRFFSLSLSVTDG